MSAQPATAAVVVGVLSACGSSSQSGGSSQPPLAGEAALRSAMTALIGKDGPPGVIAVVQNGTNVYTVAEGKAEIANAQPMTATATTRIASVSGNRSAARSS